MREKKIPTIIGLLVLIAGIAVGVFLVQNRQIFRLAASPEETPRDVRITNITDNSFSISWITDKKTVGFLTFGRATSLGQTAVDNQDDTSPTPRLTHEVTVSGLSPKTSYFFKVGSGSQTFGQDDQPWQVTTGSRLTGLAPQTDIISGKVETATGAGVVGALVYLTIQGVTPISTLTTDLGNWSVALSLARSDDLSGFASYDDQTPFSVFVQAGGGQIATAQALISVARPLPLIILGQTHDFRNLGEKLSPGTSPKSELEVVPEASPGGEASPSSGFTFEELEAASQTAPVTIRNPQEGETITTTKPEFLGTGPTGSKITIVVESPGTQTGVATVGSDGTWSWTPPSNLEPGEHLLTVSWVDQTGKKQTKSVTFVVAAAGEEVPAFTATPSGQAATPSPTPKPTATPAARVSLPSTEEGVPVAGNLTATAALFIMGLALVFLGTAALIFRKI